PGRGRLQERVDEEEAQVHQPGEGRPAQLVVRRKELHAHGGPQGFGAGARRNSTASISKAKAPSAGPPEKSTPMRSRPGFSLAAPPGFSSAPRGTTTSVHSGPATK